MGSVITIPALGDNFIYLCRYEHGKAFAVDPCESGKVLSSLKEHDLKLTHILITHHHGDHTGGVGKLKNTTGCSVISGDGRRIAGIDKVVADGDIMTIGDRQIKVIGTGGHTQTSVCYYMEGTAGETGTVWTGDTMFIGGCGRILECDASTMRKSLLKIAELPEDTLVYCGHDYTIENYEFALTIEPNNEAVQQRLEELKQMVKSGGLTVPSTIAQEKKTNLFLQTKNVETFAKLRKRKDIFG